VQWSDCVAYMVKRGITAAVECGPGKVLGGLIKRIDKSVNCFSIEDSAGLEAALSN
jgi:[acyl-carrier-protein] S-malonyltransferase